MNLQAQYPDLDPERALLGYFLMIGKLPQEANGNIQPEDFTESRRLIARSIFSAARRTGHCDVVTVANEMEHAGAGAFSVRELGSLAEAAPIGGVDIGHLLNLIRERNGRQALNSFSHPLSTLLNTPDEPIPYLADRLLVAASNGFIGGEPKSLKSWLALYLALCLSLGVPVFGRYTISERVRVLLISEEDGERRVRRRIRKLLRGLGKEAPEDGYFRYSIKAGVLLDDDKWVERLRGELGEYNPGIVIADVFELMHSKDGDKRAEMKPVFRNLDRLREEFQCGFLLTDHFKKATIGTSRRGGQRLSGTVGKHAFGECSLYLFPAQGTNRVRVETELKDGPSEVFGLGLEDTENGGVVFVWQAEADDQATKTKEKITTTMGNIPSPDGWVTAAQVGEAVGIAKNTARKYLDLLVDEDKTVEREQRQRGKVKPWCYRLIA